MKALATFSVENFRPADIGAGSSIETALPVSVSTMLKRYAGEMTGTSETVFTAAFDRAAGKGTYVAMESFDGTVNEKSGSFNFLHSASTESGSRENEVFRIVDGSGTRDLVGISGSGGIAIDADGTHRIWLEYQL
ncbi:DUF3224 domain-containing protein [Novosphingobium sp.]|jgi:hypothetical protein|uniref:DUF3224 domain-containing protein n=1 Tax=Novosphingobium sp. TaxID=1874826 RepID=UPI002FE29020